MKQEEINELLSAHLDGESEDPEAVERLLEGEPDVRRRFEILQSQSKALRSLPLPDVAPEFATRVLAGVREERLSRHRRWMPLVLPLAAAAAVVVVLGTVYFATQTRPEPGTWPAANDLRKWNEIDPEMLDAALVERMSAAPDAFELWDQGYGEAGADDSWDDTAASTLDEMAAVMDAEAELDVLIEELSAEEEAVFRELLVAYAMEG